MTITYVVNGFNLGSLTNGITAHAGGGQESATQLTTELNYVTVCATNGDSVKLPVAIAGMRVEVYNDTAHNCNVFPQSGSYMNGVLDAADNVATTGENLYIATDSTHWWRTG
jgi:hypothetical protein